MKKILFASAVALMAAMAFVGCSKDEDDPIPATAVSLDVMEQTLGIGEMMQLTATPAPANTTDRAVWSVDKTAVITVSETGMVKAMAVGTATVTVTYGTVSATCAIEVADYKRISFESDESMTDYLGEPVVLGHIDAYSSGNIAYSRDHVFWAKPYAVDEDDAGRKYWQGPYFQALNDKAMFGGYYNDGTSYNGTSYPVTDTWGGFVLSQHVNKEATTSDWTNQFDVWAEGGANGSATFAVGYDGNTAGAGWSEPQEYNAPQIDFAEAMKPVCVYLSNSTYTYTYFTGEPTDTYAVKITGWLNGSEGKSVTCTLVSGTKRVEDWVRVDLSSLGEVDKLTFTSIIAAGTYTPCYFCLDDLYLE